MAETLTQENYKELVAGYKGRVLVDYWAEWCGPCKMFGPILEEAETELTGLAKVCKVNVDEERELAQKADVMSIPTVVLYENGEEISRLIGVHAKDEIVAMVKEG